MRHAKGKLPISRRAFLRLAIFYAGFGLAWIILSDLIVYSTGGASLIGVLVSIGKGLLFVASSAVAIYLYSLHWARTALIASNAKIQGIIDGSHDIIAAVDENEVFTLCNQAKRDLFERITGVQLGPGMSLEEEEKHPWKSSALVDCWRSALRGEFAVREWSCGKGADEVFYESHFAPLIDAKGRITGAFHIGRDVSERKRLEFELRKLTTAIEQSPVSVVITDAEGSIEYVNPAFTTAFGFTAEEAIGQNSRILKGGETTRDEYTALWQSILGGKPWSGQFHNRRKDGSFYWEEAVIAPVRDLSGNIAQFIAVKQDVTLRREAEEKARFLALHDPLTKLPNRVLGRRRMEEAISRAQDKGTKSALLFLDIDNFKRINDSLGHVVGDHLLQALVRRVVDDIRQDDMLIRLGGDEFLIVVAEVESGDDVSRVAARVLEHTAETFRIDGFDIAVSVSIGIAIYPEDGLDFELLQRRADLAMYVAKNSGRKAFRFYDKALDDGAQDSLAILNGLSRALERDEFFLVYQPQIDLQDGKVIGVEALLRWNHPNLGVITPDRFIPAAENSGYILDIGRWVLNQACRQAAEWKSKWKSKLFEPFTLAVNLSPVQFKGGGLQQTVLCALSQASLDPCSLQLELTESVLIDDHLNASAILKDLKDLGVGLSLDDFGTGYSTFAYLRTFTLDKLKIDRSFVRDIEANTHDEKIVRSITQLANEFELRTVAEGVESAETLRILRNAGCHEAQGYFFSHPLSSDEFECFLGTYQPHIGLA